MTITLPIAVLARRWELPYTLVLVIVGLVLGLLGVVPALQLNPEVILYLFLPALLFEGAWSMDLRHLRQNWFPVLWLAGPGLVISLIIVAVVAHFGAGLNWPIALLLGAIVSPTDPVAVLALFRQLGIVPRLRTIIEGESLFNDGIGAAAVTLLLAVAFTSSAHPASPWVLTLQGVWEIAGGPLLGVLMGYLVAQGLRLVDDHLIETAVTVAVAYGAFLLATDLHTSGLLAVVMAGLVLAGTGRRVGFSEQARDTADEIWEFTGYVANSLLFLLLGVQIGAAQFASEIPAIIWTVGGVLVGRMVMVVGSIPLINALARHLPHELVPRTWQPVLIFSGLRGALSLALVLSLDPAIPQRNVLEGIVYGVVLVTLLGQGLGLRLILPRWQQLRPPAPTP